MHRVTTGTIEQIFEVKIDFEELNSGILELIREAGEKCLKDFSIDIDEFDRESVSLVGKYTTDYKRDYYSATRECPEEIDIERKFLSEEVSIDKLLKDHAAELINCLKIDVFEEDRDAVWLEDGVDRGSVFEDMFDDEDF